MSMTWEEAIAVLEESKRQNEVMRDNPSTFWASHQMADGVKNAERRIAAFNMALTALRPVSREQVEKAEWIWSTWDVYICSSCGEKTHVDECMGTPIYNFCPFCMAPMTDEAVDMVMERWKEAIDVETD